MEKGRPTILLLSASPEKSTGGIATWTEGYLSYCAEKGIFCRLIDTSKINNIQNGGAINEIKRTLRIFRQLSHAMKNDKFDVAHINTNIGVYGIIRDCLAAGWIKAHKIPVVLHFHCDIPFWDKGKIIGFFLSRILKLADMTFVLCDRSRVYLREKYGCDAVSVPNGIDFPISDQKKEIRETIRTVIYTGRVSEVKGSPEILALAERFPEMLFYLVGNVSSEMAQYQKPNNVTYTGLKDREAVLRLLEEADLFLFPSHSEGFSLSLAEAMAKGLPCVVTDVGANADMVSGGAGVVVPVGDVAAMEKAVAALQPAQARSEMSEAAMDKVKENYTADRVMDRMIRLYRQVY